MNTDIIAIGDEILIGQITDTNSQWIAEQLNLSGFHIRQITTVGDNKSQIKDLLNEITPKTDLIIMTGGLGPTDDDITKETLTEYFNTKLMLNTEVLDNIKRLFKAKTINLNERNIKQAEVPESCKLIKNSYGTAPGMWFERNNTIYISLPAVPFEMKKMMSETVLKHLRERFQNPAIIHRTVLSFGIPESKLAELLTDWERKLDKNIKLAYLPSPERIRLRLSMVCSDKAKAETLIDSEISKLEGIIGEAIFAYGDTYLQNVVGKLLSARKETLSVAESCTGGHIGHLITSVDGSSGYFRGGIIAYSNDVKISQLKVPKEIIDKYGAVSKETVEYMALGVRSVFNTDYAIAVSGIAGPQGGTEEKPVGTTWIAVAYRDHVLAKKFIFVKLRDINIRLASSKALDMLRKLILGYYIE